MKFICQLEDSWFLLIAPGLINVRTANFDELDTVVMGTGMCCTERRPGQLGSMRTVSGSMGERRG